jgi:hypothetical protein
MKTLNNSAAVCADELPAYTDNSEKNISSTLFGQSREKYCDYFVFNIVNCNLQRSRARRRALAQTIGNVRGLDINSSQSAENHP